MNRQCVTLDLAFYWTCPDCGMRQFSRGYAPEFDREAAGMIVAKCGDAADGLKCAPAGVKCQRCGLRFKTEI